MKGAQYDQVHSLAGAGMPDGWESRSGTDYYHWAYTDVLTMAQETGAVWGGNIPARDSAFASRVFEREGDFTLYLPSSTAPGGVPTSPLTSMPASTTAFDNHNLIASDRTENQRALEAIQFAIQSGGAG